MSRLWIIGVLIFTSVLPLLAQNDCFPPPSGIVAWWPADNFTKDVIGHSPAGVKGASFAQGIDGAAFNFFGQPLGGFYVVPTAALSPEKVTLEAWVFPTAFANDSPSVIRRNSGT